MAVKLTKNELKVQKDRLKQFQRYLPTLQLKKQQLQSVVMQVTAQLEQVEQQRRAAVAGLDDWVAVFAENDSFPADKRLETLIRPHHVVCGQENIAGVTVPVFQELTFEDICYDVADYPLWVDTAAVRLREIAALDAMKYLQDMAGVMNKLDLPIKWTTPAGFPVVQKYMDKKARRIETKIGDKIIKLSIDEPSDSLDKPKQKSAISPNYVHSLDAAALMKTVNGCLANISTILP